MHWEIPTNRWVLLLLPVGLILGALKGYLGGADIIGLVSAACWFALAMFAGWALARELHPDDNPAAFLAMLFSAVVAWVATAPSLLVVFATLILARIANRSTGLAARPFDSVTALLLVFAVIYATDSPWYGVVGAVAFALDGSLVNPLRRHWAFALVCFAGTFVWLIDHDSGFGLPGAPERLFEWMSLLFLLMFLLNIMLFRTVSSVADVGTRPLDVKRIRGGMLVALLAGVQGLTDVSANSILIAVLAAISIDQAVRKSFKTPAVG